MKGWAPAALATVCLLAAVVASGTGRHEEPGRADQRADAFRNRGSDRARGYEPGVDVRGSGRTEPDQRRAQRAAEAEGHGHGDGRCLRDQPIGVAYDANHQLYVALPGSFGPPPVGTVQKVGANGKTTSPVPGTEGMVAPDGFWPGFRHGGTCTSPTSSGNGLWRFTPTDGTAQLWTSFVTNPTARAPARRQGLPATLSYLSREAGKDSTDSDLGRRQPRARPSVWAHVD